MGKTFVLRRIDFSLELSKRMLKFLFENLRNENEIGIHLYLKDSGRILVLDKWFGKPLDKYYPSEGFLKIEERIEKMGYEYKCYFHNHNYFDEKYVKSNSIINLPSATDIWSNNIPYVGIVRNFAHFSDLRIFVNRCTDYSYPPFHFIEIKSELGSGSRVIYSKGRFKFVDEKELRILDDGHIQTAILLQSM